MPLRSVYSSHGGEGSYVRYLMIDAIEKIEKRYKEYEDFQKLQNHTVKLVVLYLKILPSMNQTFRTSDSVDWSGGVPSTGC